ncbi:MAG: aldehyde ferredoxin oxidoreductase family protein [Candidatus Bathyarchaeia archaeon]
MGYMGKILWVDLSEGKFSIREETNDLRKLYLGGVGFAAKILWEETTAKTDAFSPENLLIFMTGPVTGTSVPCSSRYIVASISPLTNIWGEAHAGGSWGSELKFSGFDGVIIRGVSKRPVYLWIEDGEAELRDAKHLWGLDTYSTCEVVRKETDPNASVAAIGPAGENLVRFACIINDGKIGRAAARCGLGAVMGYKNLKAIAVKGTKKPKVYNEDKIRESVKELLPSGGITSDVRKNFVMQMLTHFVEDGNFPVKNWLKGTFEGFKEKIIDEWLKAKPSPCRGCPTGCLESNLTDNGERHIVWEAVAPMGSQCLIDDMKALQKAYTLCNMYGLDTISTGGVISFAMECFEKNIITREDTEGLDLSWGNSDALIELIERIARRRSIGKILGEGVKRASEFFGGLAYEYALHVKGLEIPAHDPRAIISYAVAYATGSVGATHTEALRVHQLEIGNFLYPELGYSIKPDRFESCGKGILAAKFQNLHNVIDSMVCCEFLLGNWALRRGTGVQPSYLVKWINYVTGWDLSINDMLKIGERIFTLKRMFNIRRGISRKDDILPPRFLTHKRGSGGAAESLPFLGKMLNEYYRYRGWSEEGLPTEEKLKELGLSTK